jgi:aminopeptidase N
MMTKSLMTESLQRASRLFVGSLIAMLLAVANAAADTPFSFEGTPGRLPKTVVPIHYSIALTPDVEALKFTGTESVEIEVRAPVDALVLNAVDITIASASIEGVGPASGITFNPGNDTVTIALPRSLAPGKYRLAMAFAGNINVKNRRLYGRGIFASDYQTPQGKRRMIATNLEPAEARRIFPGWDEPSFKAVFELSLTVSDKHLAVSNMPVAHEEPAGDGLKRVSFQPSPKMSSYLFVFAAGELERTTVEAEGVTIGVVGTAGSSAQAHFALTSAAKILKYYNDYFGLKYALPKLDLIAVPGGIGFGMAMENWGGITFHEGALLFDEANGAEEARRGIFMIIAHEMAHQWFGNLVTMAWWDNLWLNEGFATWMQYKATDHLNPDWNAWLYSSFDKQQAMKKDAGRTSHPIQQPITNDRGATSSFDAITYSKGQALVRMAESYLGEEVFRDGIQRYMAAHTYSNSTSADLWTALEAASGKQIAAVANRFIEQAGIPLVLADAECAADGQRMKLRQERFTIQYPNAEPNRWQVPIQYGPVRAGQKREQAILDGASEIFTGPCNELAKLNLGDNGYYRVKYDPVTLAALQKAIRTMAPADQANLIADIRALGEAGSVVMATTFDLIDAVSLEPDPTTISEAIRTFERVDHLGRGRPGQDDYHAYVRNALRPVFDRLGWDPQAGESRERALLRAKVVRALGVFGDQDILAEAKRRFNAFLRDPASLDKELRDSVIYLAGRQADRATYDTLLRRARDSQRDADRVRYYSAAAAALDPALARETLSLAINDEALPVPAGDLIEWVAEDHRDLAWTFVRANFEALASQQGELFRETFVANLVSNFTDRARADELAAFAPAHETPVGRIVAERARQNILADSALAEREFPAVAEWVRRRNDRR